MYKLFKLPLLLCILMLFVTCSKDPETPKANIGFWEEEPTFTIEDEKVSALFSGTVEHKGKIMKVTLKLDTDTDFSDAVCYEAQLVDASFSVSVPNLNPDAEYHYCYCIDYGVSSDYVVETKTIATPSLPEPDPDPDPIIMLPTVVTEGITALGVRGRVVDDGGDTIIERGIYWGVAPYPDLSGTHIPAGDSESFVVMLNLEPGVYYVRAYATNSVGTGYGDDLLFVAKGGVR